MSLYNGIANRFRFCKFYWNFSMKIHKCWKTLLSCSKYWKFFSIIDSFFQANFENRPKCGKAVALFVSRNVDCISYDHFWNQLFDFFQHTLCFSEIDVRNQLQALLQRQPVRLLGIQPGITERLLENVP